MNLRALLESQLKRWPALYRLVASIYFALKPSYLAELVVGTRVREREWARRHLRKGSDWNSTQNRGEDDEWVLGYWDSRNHSHRLFLMERISAFYPFSNILEVGCNCGPNLYLVAKKFPDVEIAGIDINPRAIEKGSEWFASEGISNVRLAVGKANRLEQFPDKSFDIVLTDAILIYVGPDKINQVIQEMLRVTRRVLILLERHHFKPDHRDPHGLGIYHQGLWVRDYIALLRQFVPESNISVIKIPEGVWPGWEGLGAIIEVLV